MEIRVADCPLGAKCEEVKNEGDRQVLYRCPWYVKLRGKHPQSNAELDEWACAIAWLPILQIETAQQSRQTGAAVESFRNEMVRGQQTVLRMAANGKIKEIANARDDHRG